MLSNICNMSVTSLRRYIEFREAQVLKQEVILDDEEITELLDRLEELRKDQQIKPLKYAVILSQIQALERWNRENKEDTVDVLCGTN